MLTNRPTAEMKVLIEDLKWKYRGIWYVDRFLITSIDKRILGKEGGIPKLKNDIKDLEASLKDCKKALNACEKQLKVEAAEIYAIPDLPNRIKERMVRMGCRTRMDIHLTTVWRYRTHWWGRVSERQLSEWKDRHFSEDRAIYEAERETNGTPNSVV